jgi:hypothetical protein
MVDEQGRIGALHVDGMPVDQLQQPLRLVVVEAGAGGDDRPGPLLEEDRGGASAQRRDGTGRQ